MWFLWLIVGLYVVVPILRMVTQNLRVMEYFLFLSFVFSFVVPFIFDLTKMFFPNLSSLVEIGEMYCEKLQLYMFSGFTFYFVLGYYLHTIHINKKIERFLILIGACSAICIAGVTYFLFRSSSVLNEDFYDYDTFLVLLESITVFLLVKRFGHVETKALNSISKLTFGIYLVHMLVYYMIGFTSTTINPIIGIPLLSLLVFVTSYVIVWVLSHIPLLQRWII